MSCIKFSLKQKLLGWKSPNKCLTNLNKNLFRNEKWKNNFNFALLNESLNKIKYFFLETKYNDMKNDFLEKMICFISPL